MPKGPSTRVRGTVPGVTRTILVPTPDGPQSVDVTVNVDGDGRPLELFVHGAPSDLRTLVNAVCRLASCALQRGVPVERVVHMLAGQDDGAERHVRWRVGDESIKVTSIPDALAKVLSGASS